MLQIVKSSAEPPDLKDHLEFVLRKMVSTQRRSSSGEFSRKFSPSRCRLTLPGSHGEDLPVIDGELHRIMLNVRGRDDVSQTFLKCAVQSDRSILCILAQNNLKNGGKSVVKVRYLMTSYDVLHHTNSYFRYFFSGNHFATEIRKSSCRIST